MRFAGSGRAASEGAKREYAASMTEPSPPPLTDTEVEFMRKHSGTVPNLQALDRAKVRTRHERATVKMPDLPFIEEISQALPAGAQEDRAIDVTAFVDNARVDVPNTEQVMTVRDWLEAGGDPRIVLDLAESLHWDL